MKCEAHRATEAVCCEAKPAETWPRLPVPTGSGAKAQFSWPTSASLQSGLWDLSIKSD